MKASERRSLALVGLERMVEECKDERHDREQARAYRYQLLGGVDIAIRTGVISENEGQDFMRRGGFSV